jgi:hypothetical protein
MIRVIDAEHLQVGERVWWGEYRAHDSEGAGYEWKTRQFVVHFESGWSGSLIWGDATYSDNHDLPFFTRTQEFNETPETVELAIFHKDHDSMRGGDVMGYMDEDDVNFTLDQMAAAHTDDSLIVRGHIALFLRSHDDIPSGK